ncbi:hypothetical protein [Streptomyces triticiradicis]|uniref:Uncharacterized protein n=1 Tax=Streptomyces triticiradicis TaxID=2651189 RepID=A0A7J5DM57_9ACTN|nr:hypothetical protein [Streptomyces triticiradicis]KAB1989831.1 hypothetical protein F8144_05655 [Streptomyces triticiradicis]
MPNSKAATLRAELVTHLGVTHAAADNALLVTLDRFHSESHEPAVARAGLTPTEYMRTALDTLRFKATLIFTALLADGRGADARLSWEMFIEEEIAVIERAREALPPTALLQDVHAMRRIGRSLGLRDEQTGELVPGIIHSIAAGYPYRGPCQQDLSLTDILALVTTEDLTHCLRHAALVAEGRSRDAAEALRRMQHGAH